jgi:hypothetical protein
VVFSSNLALFHYLHNHLGKIITYASGLNASVIIWVFENIRDEHRQAIEWLNQHMDDEVDFFAVKLQLWKVDNSRPAPRFDIVVSPNEWTKAVRRRGSQPAEITDTKLKQLKFWRDYKDYAIAKDRTIKLQTPRPQHWFDYRIGFSHAHLALTVNTKENQIAIELYINNDKDLYSYLVKKTQEIEDTIESQLDWIDANKASRIKLSRLDSDISNKEFQEDYFEWLFNNMALFKKTFSKLIQNHKRQQ